MKKQNRTTKKPTHEVFQVIEIGKDRSYWNRIGAAWEHEDNQGLSVTLQSLPLDGRIVLRTTKDNRE